MITEGKVTEIFLIAYDFYLFFDKMMERYTILCTFGYLHYFLINHQFHWSMYLAEMKNNWYYSNKFVELSLFCLYLSLFVSLRSALILPF